MHMYPERPSPPMGFPEPLADPDPLDDPLPEPDPLVEVFAFELVLEPPDIVPVI